MEGRDRGRQAANVQRTTGPSALCQYYGILGGFARESLRKVRLGHSFFGYLQPWLVFRFYGCYENLAQGSTTRALQDLTGGIVQSFGLTHQDRFLTFQVLNSAVPRSSLLIATIAPVSYIFIFTHTFLLKLLLSGKGKQEATAVAEWFNHATCV